MPQDTTYEREWIPRWTSKRIAELGIKVGEVADLCHVSSQRISQVKNGTDDPPSLYLLWRMAAVLNGEEEHAAMSDDHIRGVLERLIVGLGPRRLLYLTELSTSRAQTLLDDLELRAAGILRVAEGPPPWGNKES